MKEREHISPGVRTRGLQQKEVGRFSVFLQEMVRMCAA